MLFIWLKDQWGEKIRDFFESESGSVYNGSGSALNPNPDPCIMGPDPHFF
jgi:hypothetical protein